MFETFDLIYCSALMGSLELFANCTALVTLNLVNCVSLRGSAMALVACTQLKKLDLRYTKLTDIGELRSVLGPQCNM